MRTTTIILFAIGLISLSSCNQKTDSNAMLENSETRTELFDAIASNYSYMTEFIDKMEGNEHAVQMMQDNQMMMGTMKKDSMMKKNMMQSMMKDGKMMGNMMQMMHEKGMMSEDCMESCKKMMDDKGMDMKEMDDMGTSTKNDHSEHH